MAAPGGEAGGGDAGAEGADAFDLTTLEGQLQRLASVLPPDVICTMIVARVAASWDAKTVKSACKRAAMRGDVRTLAWLFDLDCVPHFGPHCVEEVRQIRMDYEGEDSEYYACLDLWHSRLAELAIEFVTLENPLSGGHVDVFRWLHLKGFYVGGEGLCGEGWEGFLDERVAQIGSYAVLQYLAKASEAPPGRSLRVLRDDTHVVKKTLAYASGSPKVLMPDGRRLTITEEMLKNNRFPSEAGYSSWDVRGSDRQSLTTPGKVSHRLLRSLQVLLDHGVLDRAVGYSDEVGCLCHDAAEEMVLYSARTGHLRTLKYLLGIYPQWGSRGEPVRWPERDLTGLAKRAFAAAAAGGHLVCLKFMHTHFLSQEERFQALKEQGWGDSISFPVIKEHKNDIPWDESATAAAVAHEQLLALTFLWAHDCPWSDATRERAAELGFAPAAQEEP